MTDKDQCSSDHEAATVPQLGEHCLGALRDAGFDSSLLDKLLASITTAGKLVDRIPDSAQVRFPATRPAPEPMTHEFILAHWTGVTRRLSLAQLAADRALRDLLVGFVGALQTRNAVTACLCARASIENAAAYDSLSRFFAARKERIEADILPYFKDELQPDDLATLYDRPLIDELIRFCYGARLWPTGDCPTTVAEWKAWRKHSRYESKQATDDDGDEQSIAGQLLDALSMNQRNVLSLLEKVAKRSRNMEVLGLYDMLSEFCHPNADNRSIGTKANRLEEGIAIVDVVGTRSWTPGTIKGTRLSMIGIIEAIDIHVGANDAIHDSAQELCEHLALSSLRQT
ncbi:MAG: hypothetical protein IH991_14795 [Planctomycetes bacterium]|nr:hypothetical protein [Planctomycetota bacterium]